MTYVVSAGTDIVAYEKFSGLYTKLNTYQPLCSVELRDGSTNQYAFSGIGSESPQGSAWGWPLTLPVIYDIGTVNDNYNFYPYSSVYEGTVVGGIIDFTNPLTTLSFNEPLSTMRGNEKIDDIDLAVNLEPKIVCDILKKENTKYLLIMDKKALV